MIERNHSFYLLFSPPTQRGKISGQKPPVMTTTTTTPKNNYFGIVNSRECHVIGTIKNGLQFFDTLKRYTCSLDFKTHIEQGVCSVKFITDGNRRNNFYVRSHDSNAKLREMLNLFTNIFEYRRTSRRV